jgi:hypothetical protein
MKIVKALFPQSNWKIQMVRRLNRVEIALYWGDKEIPTHETAIDVVDLCEALGILCDQ